MTRRVSDDDDSLGLLLDTISNAFGAIVFLALAIVVMLNQVPQLHHGIEELKHAQLELELSRVHREVDDLDQVRQFQNGKLESLEEQVPGLLSDIQEWESTTERLRAEHERLHKTIHGNEESVTAAEQRVESLASELTAAERDRDAARMALDAKMDSRSTDARISRVRQTSKSEVGILLRYRRLYVWHRYDAAGNPRGLNTDEFIVVQDHGDHTETAPRPGAGVPTGAPAHLAGIRKRLGAFDPRRHYFAIIVWPDSFDAFQQVKGAMVQSGFEYRLVLATTRSEWFDRGGRSGSVQ